MAKENWHTSNQRTKEKGQGACAEVYPGNRNVPLPPADKGGISPGTKDRIKDEQAVPGNPYPEISSEGSTTD